jgi:uncharacterized Zn finger protein
MATRFGLTWWGRRWIGSLEKLGAAYANRLPRGRTYARRGAVRRLEVGPGEVTARVDGSRAVPYRVTLRLPTFTEAEWDAVVAALAEQLRHAAALLDGRMPEDIDDTLAGCGLSLFPHAGDLATNCSCPDHANPCKHVAAVHYVLAQTFDDDPFLLPALRGRDRAALLAALRTARTGGARSPVAVDAGGPTEAGAGVPLADLHAGRLYDARADLAAIALHPAAPADPTATVRRLGPPPVAGEATGEALAEIIARAADRAWALVSGAAPGSVSSEACGFPGAADDSGASDDGRRIRTGDDASEDRGADRVLAELRRRGTATTRELADALGRPAGTVRAALRALVADGAVERSGRARATRYHAW